MMSSSHGGSEYFLRSSTVSGVAVDHSRHLRSIRKKPRTPFPKPSKAVAEAEQEAVGGGTDSQDSGSDSDSDTEPVFQNPVFSEPPPLLAEPGEAEYQTERCSDRAVSEWNETKEPKYELVKPIRSAAGAFPQGLVFHCNFEAKQRDDPDAPVELFFAQLFRPWNKTHVGANLIESLGVSTSTSPDDYEECADCDMCGCGFIRHPKNREFMGMAKD